MNAALDVARLGEVLASAKNIYVSGCAAEISELPALFTQHRPSGAIVTGIFSPLVSRRSYADANIGLRVRSFFLTRQLKEQLATGMVDYCPWRYHTIDRWLAAPGRFDTAVVMLSPPDDQGNCSLGVQADFLPSFSKHVRRVVGFINPRMPRTRGDTLIDYASLTAVVDCDAPLMTMLPKPPDAQAVAIANRISELVQDDSTLQFGIGQIPSQVIARLGNHRMLRVHSGIIDDNILPLEISGALDRDIPIVTGTAIGTTDLYDALADGRRFSLRAVSYTHAFRTIAVLKRFTAVNSVLQVDLMGQMSAEGSGGALVASPGGLPDFVRGALESDGGRSIIAVRGKGVAGHPGGVVPLLGSSVPVTVGAGDADIIVTEFGAAHVRHLSIDARAEAIIAIAAPEDQQQLAREWARVRSAMLVQTRLQATK
jgi:acyl-CoA hydrolase